MTNPTLSYGGRLWEDCDTLDWNTDGVAEAGSDATHTIDTAHRTEANDFWNGAYIKYVTGDNAGDIKKVTDFDAGTDTLTHQAFDVAVAADDQYLLTDYKESTSPTLSSTDLHERIGDIFRLKGTCAAATDEKTYWELDITNISTQVVRQAITRWKTSDESTGIGARVELVFAGDSQFVVGADAPEFSSTWTTTTTTIDENEIIDKIRFYADDYPDSTASGTSYVYYDFLLLTIGTFTFPQVDTLKVRLPNRVVGIEIPGRVGDIHQYLGMNSPEIRLGGLMKSSNTDWGSPFGQYLYQNMLDSHDSPFFWFTSDLINCKVQLPELEIAQERESGHQRTWNMLLKHYSLSSGDESDWGNYLEWLGLT